MHALTSLVAAYVRRGSARGAGEGRDEWRWADARHARSGGAAAHLHVGYVDRHVYEARLRGACAREDRLEVGEHRGHLLRRKARLELAALGEACDRTARQL